MYVCNESVPSAIFGMLMFTPCLFVVVEHSVHALDPERVDGPIKHYPLPIRRLRRGELAEGVSHNPIRPLKTRKRERKKERQKKEKERRT